MAESDDRLRLLRWYVEMGADEAIGGDANDRFAARPITFSPPGRGQGEGAAPAPPVARPPHPAPLPGGERGKNASAREAAASASTLEELRAASLAFEDHGDRLGESSRANGCPYLVHEGSGCSCSVPPPAGRTGPDHICSIDEEHRSSVMIFFWAVD